MDIITEVRAQLALRPKPTRNIDLTKTLENIRENMSPEDRANYDLNREKFKKECEGKTLNEKMDIVSRDLEEFYQDCLREYKNANI